MSFSQLIGIEFTKVKRSNILPIMVIAPLLLVISGINSLIHYISPDSEGAWQAMFVQSCLLFAYYLLPLTMVVVSILIKQREKANNGLLKMLALPIKREQMALAKFVVFLTFLLLEILLFFVFFILAGLVATYSIGLNDPVPYGYIAKWSAILFFTAIPFTSCIWLLANVFNKALFTIGFSMFMIIGSIFMANTNVWMFYPFSYSGKLVTAELSRILNEVNYLNIEMYSFIPLAFCLTILFTYIATKRFGKKEIA
ncbi:ABC transporter permease [Bacillaceae bacterium SAS-127]|nr:ABC transporter permease [Bacillaceae bacterium SAS-127]